jgi:hypothetical protein
VSCTSYDPLFIDLGLLRDEVKKILESNYDMELNQNPRKIGLQATKGFLL